MTRSGRIFIVDQLKGQRGLLTSREFKKNSDLSKVWPLPTYPTATAVLLRGLADALLGHLVLHLPLQLRVEFLVLGLVLPSTPP
jgi:hypothetical protein